METKYFVRKEEGLCEHGKPMNVYYDNLVIDRIMNDIRQELSGCCSDHVKTEFEKLLGELWYIRHPCYTCYTTY